MKLCGKGCIKHPTTGKVIWDFVDGPFETEDQEIIEQVQDRGVTAGESNENDKESLIERAVELELGAPSTLRRWSVERLEKEIEAKEAESEDGSEE